MSTERDRILAELARYGASLTDKDKIERNGKVYRVTVSPWKGRIRITMTESGAR